MTAHCKHGQWIRIASHERADMSTVVLVYGPGLNWADELRWCIACGALQRVARGDADPWKCPSMCEGPEPTSGTEGSPVPNVAPKVDL